MPLSQIFTIRHLVKGYTGQNLLFCPCVQRNGRAVKTYFVTGTQNLGNMDKYPPRFPGLPVQIGHMLSVLDVSHLRIPVWSIKHNYGQIILEVAWTNKFPAKNHHCETKAPRPKQPGKPSSESKSQPHKKCKSPSTRKRDRERYLKWISK